MNDEIFKRLQDQCWIYNTHPDMIDDKGRPCGFDTKKFAELIVRDCIEQIYPEWIKQNTHIDPTNLADAVHRVKEHFGVEE